MKMTNSSETEPVEKRNIYISIISNNKHVEKRNIYILIISNNKNNNYSSNNNDLKDGQNHRLGKK